MADVTLLLDAAAFGDDEGALDNYAWNASNSQWHSWQVAGLKENAWGLHDMHGNVWEWCQDYFDAHYYKTSPLKDPAGPGTGGERVFRGGSFENLPVVCRSAFRNLGGPGYRAYSLGFRVVLGVGRQ